MEIRRAFGGAHCLALHCILTGNKASLFFEQEHFNFHQQARLGQH